MFDPHCRQLQKHFVLPSWQTRMLASQTQPRHRQQQGNPSQGTFKLARHIGIIVMPQGVKYILEHVPRYRELIKIVAVNREMLLAGSMHSCPPAGCSGRAGATCAVSAGS